MNVRRALIAAGMQVVATLVITTIIVTVYITMLSVANQGALPPGDAEEIGSRIGGVAGIVVGIITAFFAGWWGARGMGDQSVAQGLLIGGLIAVVGFVFAMVTAEMSAMTTILLLDVAAATAGATWARSRGRTTTA